MGLYILPDAGRLKCIVPLARKVPSETTLGHVSQLELPPHPTPENRHSDQLKLCLGLLGRFLQQGDELVRLIERNRHNQQQKQEGNAATLEVCMR
jgi:hypothetical protein